MSQVEFHLDNGDRDMLLGWGWDPGRPERRLRLRLQEGDRILAEATADWHRPDLQEAGIGDGCYAFRIALPLHVRLGAVDDLAIIDADSGRELGRVRLPELPETAEAVAARLERRLVAELATTPTAERASTAARLLAALLPGVQRAWEAAAPAATEPPGPGSFAAALTAAAARYPRLQLPLAEAPAVTIIIPVYDQFALTHGCLNSLAALPDTTPFEVVLVDDGSSDETLLVGALVRNLRVVRNAANLGFIGACNAGAAQARGEYLWFLNNDTEVEPGALDALLSLMAAEPRCGIAGPKLLFGNGRLQEAGGIVFRLGDAANYGRGEDPDDPRFNYRREADYVSGAALLVRRGLFETLGGFDRYFHPAYYEDTDLCFRVRAAGWRVMYQPRAVVRHFEGGTGGTDVTQGAKRHQVANGRRFLYRWREVLARHAPSPAPLDLEKDRGVTFRVLFLDPTIPSLGTDAGSLAALSHIRAMQAMGAKVTLVATSHLGLQERDGERLQDSGVEVLHYPFIWSVEEVLRRRPGEFDAIYLHRAEVALRHLETCRQHAPKAWLIYNLADLHFLRVEREQAIADLKSKAFILAGLPPERLRDAELAAAKAADAIIVHSMVEAAMLREAGVETVSVVPWEVPLLETEAAPKRRRGLLFVGGFRHMPNLDGLLWFMEQAWPALREARPDLTLTVVGSHMPEEVAALAQVPGVSCLGRVDNLEPLYAGHRLAIAPLRYGAGLKGKVIEAMAAGLPCVGTEIAYEGVDFAAEALVTAPDAAGMVGRIIALLDNNSLWERVRADGQEHASGRYSMPMVTAALKGALGPLLGRVRSAGCGTA